MNWKKVIYIITFLTVIITAIKASAVSLEDKVKVGLIYNVLKFIDTSRQYNNGTISICLVGSNPFGSFIDELERKKIKGMNVVVYKDVGEIDKCVLAYISESEYDNLPYYVSEAQKHNVLTVSSIEGFAKNGGIVEFASLGENIGMIFNNTQAKKSGISISSKLLNLGKRVY